MMLLKELRKERGLTQEKAAKAIGVSYSTLSKVENGIRGLSDKNKVKIADFYGRSVQDIFFERNNHEE